jgi:hypothetical protein
MEGSGRGLIEVQSQHFPGGTEENNEKFSLKLAGVPIDIWNNFQIREGEDEEEEEDDDDEIDINKCTWVLCYVT